MSTHAELLSDEDAYCQVCGAAFSESGSRRPWRVVPDGDDIAFQCPTCATTEDTAS